MSQKLKNIVAVLIILIAGGWIAYGGYDIYQNVQESDVYVPKTIEDWEKEAATGNAEAQYQLALKYDNGRGVEVDKQKAFDLYLKAAEQGHEKAQFNLANSYAKGEGTEKNLDEAEKWFLGLAEKGDVKAQYALGYHKNGAGQYEEALDWYMQAYQNGHKRVVNNIAWLYAQGLGVEKDPKQAFDWYLKNADAHDNARIHYFLGWSYYNGENTEQNYKEAYKWLQVPAKEGNKSAQKYLGTMFKNGWGIEKDLTKAGEWYEKAISSGDESVKDFITQKSRYCVNNSSNNKDRVDACKIAAESGDRSAQGVLSALYLNGSGVEKDHNKYLFWLEQSALNGHPSAQLFFLRENIDKARATDKEKAAMFMTVDNVQDSLNKEDRQNPYVDTIKEQYSSYDFMREIYTAYIWARVFEQNEDKDHLAEDMKEAAPNIIKSVYDIKNGFIESDKEQNFNIEETFQEYDHCAESFYADHEYFTQCYNDLREGK